jgi:pre-mRNA-processing factor 17
MASLLACYGSSGEDDSEIDSAIDSAIDSGVAPRVINANLAVAAVAAAASGSTALALVAGASEHAHPPSATANAQYALVGSGVRAPEVPPPPPRLASHQRSHAKQVAMVSTFGFREAMHRANYDDGQSAAATAAAARSSHVHIGPPQTGRGEPKRKRRRGRKGGGGAAANINASSAARNALGDELTHGPWAPVAEQAKVPEPAFADRSGDAAATLSSSSSSSSSASSSSSSSAASSKTSRDSHIKQDGDGKTAAERTLQRLARETSSVFHGAAERDYQGRPWCARPRGVNPDEEHDCFVPKRTVRTLTGHDKGVWDVAFAPRFGHLLLSASTDKTVKAWNFRDDPEDYSNMRTYYGHTEAVKSVRFSGDGASFVTASFDRTIRVWDAETGTCTGSFSNGSIPNQALFSQREPTVVMSACKNRRVMQYDLRSGEMVQEYNYHLDAVNSVTFYDDGNRFMSTSDDKKILLWDYNTPTPHKYIAEPHMHSMPAATLSPDGAHIAGQCMDNAIRVYSTQGRFSLAKNREFKGHVVSGYACQIAFSPNGRFLASGDEGGQLWFWDWLRCRKIKTLRGHTGGPCIGLKWHPLRPSCVVSCGWDGKIKVWD